MSNNQKKRALGLFQKGTRDRVSFLGSRHDLKVMDTTVHKSTVHKFCNLKPNPIEVEYKFATTETTTIFSIEVELFDPVKNKRRVILAKVFPKDTAKEKYDDAVSQGETAMLAEEDDDDDSLVRLALGCISEKMEVSVKIESTEELEIERNVSENSHTIKFEIPSANFSGGTIKDAVGNIEAKMDVMLASGRIVDVVSPSHPKQFTKTLDEEKSGNCCSFETREKLSSNDDIVVNVVVKDIESAWGVVEKDESGGNFTSVVSVLPVLKDRSTMSEFNVIVDCSGSMSNERIRKARTAMLQFVDNLEFKKHKIALNIVRFGSTFEKIFDAPKLITSESDLDVFRKYIRETEASLGGTNILDPIQDVLDQPVLKGFSRQVFFLSDGEDWKTEEILSCVRKNSNNTRFFSFGIGEGVNPVLIRGMARASYGRAVFIQKDDDGIEKCVLEQLKYATQPALTNVNIKFTSTEGRKVEVKKILSHVPPCFNFSKTSSYFVSSECPAAAEIEYSDGNESKKLVVKMNLVKDKKLPILAANKRVVELEKYGVTENKVKRDEEIESLGMEYNFLTSRTSFLMVDETEKDTKIDKEMILEKIPSVVVKLPRRDPSMLCGSSSCLLLLDVTPLSLGFERADGVCEKILPRNFTIPVKKSVTFTFQELKSRTVEEDGKNVNIVYLDICEGERKFAADNNLLETLDVRGVEENSTFSVTFNLDANGILIVSCEENRLQGSGKATKITIKNDKGRLTKQQIEDMLQDADKMRKSDEKRAQSVQARNTLELFLYALKKLFVGKEHVDFIDEMLKWVDDHNTEEKHVYEAKMNEVREKFRSLVPLLLDVLRFFEFGNSLTHVKDEKKEDADESHPFKDGFPHSPMPTFDDLDVD